ncbi:MAG: NUDIX domain-containing protein, partial [Alphaproteobacteria bacterium]
GKLESGESFENCAIRELNEELNIEILAGDLELFEIVNHCYDEFNIEMNVYCCNNWNNEIKPQENQKYKWFSQNEIDYNEILPADIELVKKVWKKVC